MAQLSFGPLKTILALGAHADDIEIGCGGTLLRLLAEQPGITVHWVVFSGSAVRVEEAKNSAARFLQGAAQSHVKIHAFRDSFFPYLGLEIKECMASLGASVSPDLVFTHRREDLHQDHRLLAELTWNAFRGPMILEYEIPKFEGDLGHPNVFVPLSEEVAQAKARHLLEAFPTQREKPWFSPETFLSLMRIRGIECQARSKFAEAFHGRKVVF